MCCNAVYWNLCSSVWSNSHTLFLIKEAGWECPIRGPWVSLSLKQLFGWAQSHFGEPKCSTSSELKAPSQVLETSLSLHLLKMILMCCSASEAGVSCLNIIFPSCFALSTLVRGLWSHPVFGWWVVVSVLAVSRSGFRAGWVLPGSVSILMTVAPPLLSLGLLTLWDLIAAPICSPAWAVCLWNWSAPHSCDPSQLAGLVTPQWGPRKLWIPSLPYSESEEPVILSLRKYSVSPFLFNCNFPVGVGAHSKRISS